VNSHLPEVTDVEDGERSHRYQRDGWCGFANVIQHYRT
jgi:hypothetical protein